MVSKDTINPFTSSWHDNIKPPHAESAENLGAVGEVCGVAGAGAMLQYLEITHTESYCHLGLCLIMLNLLWKLFGLDIPNVMSVQVGGKKLTLGTSCRRERVKDFGNLMKGSIFEWLTIKIFTSYCRFLSLGGPIG